MSMYLAHVGSLPVDVAIATNAAAAASTTLRPKIVQLAGEVLSCPKQWQTGRRPCKRLLAMPAPKTISRPKAAAAAHRDKTGASSPPATTSSITGRTTATRPTSCRGKPNAASASRVPSGSTSFADPAAENTSARTSRHTTRTAVTADLFALPIHARARARVSVRRCHRVSPRGRVEQTRPRTTEASA
jgi:hypothetical protein